MTTLAVPYNGRIRPMERSAKPSAVTKAIFTITEDDQRSLLV